jgi:hypothetical protein
MRDYVLTVPLIGHPCGNTQAASTNRFARPHRPIGQDGDHDTRLTEIGVEGIVDFNRRAERNMSSMN